MYDWSSLPNSLEWGHIKNAGQADPSLGILYPNLIPLKTAIVQWVSDEPANRWNLCDNNGDPLDWITTPAVHTLLWWFMKGSVPKILRWEDFDLYCYRSLSSEDAWRMFELERCFDAGEGFHRIAPEEGPTFYRFSARAQREAQREYKLLGKGLKLERMQSASPRYFRWYVLRTFFGFKLKEIRQEELELGNIGVGDPQDPDDFSAIAHGIEKVGDLVGFRRSFGKVAMSE